MAEAIDCVRRRGGNAFLIVADEDDAGLVVILADGRVQRGCREQDCEPMEEVELSSLPAAQQVGYRNWQRAADRQDQLEASVHAFFTRDTKALRERLRRERNRINRERKVSNTYGLPNIWLDRIITHHALTETDLLIMGMSAGWLEGWGLRLVGFLQDELQQFRTDIGNPRTKAKMPSAKSASHKNRRQEPPAPEPGKTKSPRSSPVDQPTITPAAVRAMLNWSPRRYRLSDNWQKDRWLSDPGRSGDFGVRIPFGEGLINAFRVMANVDHTPFRADRHNAVRKYTYVRPRHRRSDAIAEVEAFMRRIGRYVAIRDLLAASFALDFTFADGDPTQTRTRVSKLRRRAKPYAGEAIASDTDEVVAELTSLCAEFVDDVSLFQRADAVVAIPPSRGLSTFDLPFAVATGLAEARQIDDLSYAVRVAEDHEPIKRIAATSKLDALNGRLTVDGSQLRGRAVILIDDLYQSGVTMNFVASQLLSAGVTHVFGLALEKTCSNRDNTKWMDP